MMTTPYWMESSLPRFPKLERDARVDVVVVGGGITGLTAAYLIAKGGRSVALLERGRCAEIDTGHTTAHLTMVTDLRLAELVDRFGRNHAQAVWDAGLAAIAQIDTIV
jgi:glycine/D-amino acid oxidase-like deaminating enzyme